MKATSMNLGMPIYLSRAIIFAFNVNVPSYQLYGVFTIKCKQVMIHFFHICYCILCINFQKCHENEAARHEKPSIQSNFQMRAKTLMLIHQCMSTTCLQLQATPLCLPIDVTLCIPCIAPLKSNSISLRMIHSYLFLLSSSIKQYSKNADKNNGDGAVLGMEAGIASKAISGFRRCLNCAYTHACTWVNSNYRQNA